jgi:glycosyltransferase involved in cell wall biosynthesis
MAVRCADVIIADNKGIQTYVSETYHRSSELIAYGGDHVMRNVPEAKQAEILDNIKLKRQDYAVSVCRMEPENNCHITLEAFAKCGRELVFIGNWNHSTYGKELKERYGKCSNIHLLESVYDLDMLFTLRKNAGLYIHGHSAGGTNPSLVEAMFFGCPILAFDVVYNRATTFNKAYYFKNSMELITLIAHPRLDGHIMRLLAEQHYTWKLIAKQYEALY